MTSKQREGSVTGKLSRSFYEDELERLQLELVRMLEWIRVTGQRLVVVFEGRDAAGKGGTISRIVTPLNPRSARVVALPKPTEREQTQVDRADRHLISSRVPTHPTLNAHLRTRAWPSVARRLRPPRLPCAA